MLLRVQDVKVDGRRLALDVDGEVWIEISPRRWRRVHHASRRAA